MKPVIKHFVVLILITAFCQGCSNSQVKNRRTSGEEKQIFFEENFSDRAEINKICMSPKEVSVRDGCLRIHSGNYEAYISIPVKLPEKAVLSFRFRPDICPSTYLKISDSVNNGPEIILGSETGHGSMWRILQYELQPGTHEIRMSLENTGKIGLTIENAVFIDDLMIIRPEPCIIEIPYGTYISAENELPSCNILMADRNRYPGQPGAEIIYTVVSDTGNVSVINSAERLAPGIYKLYASYKSLRSNEITLVKPYPGSIFYRGKFYTGIKPETCSKHLAPDGFFKKTSSISVTGVEYEKNTADGFFTIKVKHPGTGPARMVLLKLTHAGTGKTDSIFFNNNVKKDIWLRHGTGDYLVSLHEMTILNESAKGSVRQFRYSVPDYVFTVTNTAGTTIELFPSHDVQAADYRIQNLAMNITFSAYGRPCENEKVIRLNEFVARLLNYDKTSIENNGENYSLQDALTVMTGRTGVCSGYTNLFTALARAAGIKVRQMSGTVTTDTSTGPHAWSVVILGGENGKEEHLLVDATFCDPERTGDAGVEADDPYNFDPKYMLIPPCGINNSHAAGKENDS